MGRIELNGFKRVLNGVFTPNMSQVKGYRMVFLRNSIFTLFQSDLPNSIYIGRNGEFSI